MDKKGLTAAVRSSLENFGLLEGSVTDDIGLSVRRAISIQPLYAVWSLQELPLPD